MLLDNVLYKYAESIQAISIDEYDEEMIDQIFKSLKARTELGHWTEDDLRTHYESVVAESKE